MDTDNVILVTGATGNVGLETTLTLLAEGRRVRAVVRDQQRGREKILSALASSPRHTVSQHEAGRLLECRSFDFLRDSASPELFNGVSGVFLMRPPNIGQVQPYIFPFLRTARDAGVRCIVLLSLLGAQKLFFIPHRKLEKEILRLGFGYHFLRAGFFMQNLDTVFRDFIGRDGELPVPAGGGFTSFVDARDLGEAAARLLLDHGEASSAPELTGSEAYDYHQVARMLSEELGYPVRYTAPGLRAFRKRALADGWDPGYSKIVGRLFYTVRFGMAARVTDDLQRILGRPPRSLRVYIRDYRPAWTAAPDARASGQLS
jgi:uncharacterized protein YbjT (DUF2867 family)